ncbi:MAG: trigger factor [Candidatus Dormibacteria bacterium]
MRVQLPLRAPRPSVPKEEIHISDETTTGVRVSVSPQPGSRVALEVIAPRDMVEEAFDRAFERVAATVKVQGFRPGRAPRALVERNLAPGALDQEALELAVSESYQVALAQAGVDPIDIPDVEIGAFERGGELAYTATVSIRPPVQLPDYRSFRVDRPRPEALDDEVDEAIEAARERGAPLAPVEGRGAQPGDQLTVDLVVMEAGAAIVGESREGVVLDYRPEGLIEGLADGLAGLEPGATRDVPVTLSAEHPNPALAGKKVAYRLTLTKLESKVLPPIDDDFARAAGYENVPDMRDQVRRRLDEVKRVEAEVRFETEVLRKLDEGAQADLPQVLVERQVDRYVREFEADLGERGLRLDRYLEYVNQDLDAFRGERREAAERRARMELLLEEVAKQEAISVEEADIEARFDELEAADKGGSTRKMRRRPAARDYVHQQLVRQKAVERLLAIAAGEDVNQPADEPASV